MLLSAQILNKVSPRAEDVVCAAANTFANKNRPGHCIPGILEYIMSSLLYVCFVIVERCQVPLKQGYINASYADVRDSHKTLFYDGLIGF